MIRSDGSPERDFLYVDDAVSAYLAIARRSTAAPAAARPSTRAASGRTRCARWSSRSSPRRAAGSSPTSRGPATPRRDRPPVRRLDQAARADRLGPGVELCGWPAPHARVVPRASRGAARASGRCGRRATSLGRHVRALHGHDQGHEDDRRPLPGRAREGAGAQLRRRCAAAGKERAKKAEAGLGRFNVAPTQEVLRCAPRPTPRRPRRGSARRG